MTLEGMKQRRAIRADVDAAPAADHLQFRSKYRVGEGIIASALTRTVAEWDALIVATPADVVEKPRQPEKEQQQALAPAIEKTEQKTGFITLGLEQGFVKFIRKPAKMGMDYIFWIPRVYVKNGLVDPSCEYEVYLKKR